MTEIQAKAGAGSGTPGKSGDRTPEAAASAGSKGTAEGSAPKDTGADDSSGGRSAVGRATVPAGEKPSPGSTGIIGRTGSTAGSTGSTGRTGVTGGAGGTGTVSGTKYTRPPGMPAPPDVAPKPASSAGVQGAGPTGVIPAVARASVRTSGVPLSLGGAGGAGSAAGSSSSTSVISAGRVTEAVRAARATVSAAAGRGPRRARLHVKRIDPWSVMKFSFAMSFVLFVVVIVATSVLYLALDAMGVFASVNKALGTMIGATGNDTNTIKITAKGVIGASALLGLVNVILFTALATLGSFVYNVCADLVGGIELTLAEKD
jgi:Transmembrane domain of unknown function (DUF3566)